VPEVCGALHPDAEEDPKNYGTPCDYPAGHEVIPDEEGNKWDHGYRFQGEPACWWNGYLGEPVAPVAPVADPWNPASPDYMVLPHPFGLQGNAEICNAPYVVNGWTVGYCTRVCKRWGKRAGMHRGDHEITWRTDG
jgi:hypothetical protein